MRIKWKGKGINEKAYDEKNNCIIQIEKRYFRPLEVHNLKGNFSKAKKVLKWKPKYSSKSGLILALEKTVNWYQDNLKRIDTNNKNKYII